MNVYFIDDGPLLPSLEHLIEYYCVYADGLASTLQHALSPSEWVSEWVDTLKSLRNVDIPNLNVCDPGVKYIKLLSILIIILYWLSTHLLARQLVATSKLWEKLNISLKTRKYYNNCVASFVHFIFVLILLLSYI